MPDALSERQLLAKAALLEITEASTVGAPAGEVDEGDGVVTFLFETTQPGYPGWKWTVTVAQVEGSEPTVLETELTPAEGALLAPDWVPWSDRMDDYRAAQIALGEAEATDDDESDDEDDVDDDDESDDTDDDESEDDDDESDDDDETDDEFVRPVLHAGDVDGVDIDTLDDSADDDSDDDDSEDDDDEDDSDDAEPAIDPKAVVVVVEEFDFDAALADDASDADPESEPVEAEPVEAEPATAPVEAEPVAALPELEVDPEAPVAPPRARRSRRATSASIAPPAE